MASSGHTLLVVIVLAYLFHPDDGHLLSFERQDQSIRIVEIDRVLSLEVALQGVQVEGRDRSQRLHVLRGVQRVHAPHVEARHELAPRPRPDLPVFVRSAEKLGGEPYVHTQNLPYHPLGVKVEKAPNVPPAGVVLS